jgi:hypothetical protein
VINFWSKVTLAAVVLVSGLLGVACKSSVQQVSVDIGNGMRKGDPPMCFQYRTESRATSQMGARNIFMHVNNTCRFAVDCMVYNDVTEQQQRVGLPGYRQYSFLLASGVPDDRVDLKLECTWKDD